MTPHLQAQVPARSFANAVAHTEWVQRFAQRLGQRSPLLRDEAEDLGTTLWQEMTVFTCPERAAEQFASSLFGQQ